MLFFCLSSTSIFHALPCAGGSQGQRCPIPAIREVPPVAVGHTKDTCWATASALRFAWDPLVPGLELSAAWPAGSSGSRSARPLQPLSAQGLTGCCLSSLGASMRPDQPCSELGSSEFSCLSPLVQSVRTSGLQQSRMKASSFRPHPGLLVHGRSLCGLNAW